MPKITDNGSAASLNQSFLECIDHQAKNMILSSIANHYGVTNAEINEEVVTVGAEHLLDYMVEPHRSAAFVLMQRHGFC